MLGFKRGLPLIAGAVGVTLAALVAPAYASGTAQLKAFVAQVKSARGEFEQKQVKGQQDGALKVSNAASGTFEFARPGRFIWRYVKP